MNLENYIKDLSPELQEKARACGSVDELVALAKEVEVPLPGEALAAIAGGEDQEVGKCHNGAKCPKCGCTRIGYQEDTVSYYIHYHYCCTGCGYEWDYYMNCDV